MLPPGPDLLDACFALHRSRMLAKGRHEAVLGARAEQFLRELARATADASLRLSLLRRQDRFAAACLSFVHHGRYQAHVSGWDQAHARFDLGRQVIYHQILAELPRGLRQIDLLGGDLDYKREFGLERTPTADVIARPSAAAATRERLVRGAIRVFRSARAALRPEAVR